ncbi:MAG: DUF4239 domain-containing protein [Candidatus Melainabacteria bacterium]|nr:DUF4239 domain-containing protein [Candidatus Melainabacteria bacterium]
MALLIGAIVVIVSSAVAAAGAVLVRKWVTVPSRESVNNIGGSLFQVIGTLYAVLLGLIVVDTMNTMAEIRVTIEQEANAVANIFILADGLPSATGERVKKLAASYVDIVIDEEWQAMSRCQVSKKAAITVDQLWRQAIGCKPEDDSQTDIRSRILSQMENLGDCRRKRLLSSMHGVSPVLWAVLITGGITTVAFTYLFAVESLTFQLIMTGVVAASVSLNVYLVFLFGYPFSGAYSLNPEGFMADRIIFKIRESGLLDRFQSDEIDLNQLRDHNEDPAEITN